MSTINTPTTAIKTPDIAPKSGDTAMVPYMAPLQKPEPGSEAEFRFRTDAEAMMTVFAAAEVNARTIVLWDGTPRFAADLVRAWRKDTQSSEGRRLHKR